MEPLKKTVFFIVLSLLTYEMAARHAPSAPENLRVNYITQPLNIDMQHPRFSWILFDVDRNEIQSAYEILVASSPELLAEHTGDFWSTGKVESSLQNGILYDGKPLQSKSQYWWKVRTWDKDDLMGDWSEMQVFETSMIDGAGWSARFITGHINLARKRSLLCQLAKKLTGPGYMPHPGVGTSYLSMAKKCQIIFSVHCLLIISEVLPCTRHLTLHICWLRRLQTPSV